MDDNEVSGFISNSPIGNGKDVAQPTAAFSDMADIPSQGFNRLVRARRYGRMWMLKGLKKEYIGQGVYEALLRKEFDITVSLQHPGICAASSFEQVEGVGPCIVMEWVDGVTLSEWLSQKKVSRKRRMSVFSQVLDAVEYAHSHQVAHRDLKPSNILITRNGERVKLIDFGLGDTDSYLILKQPAGTKGYISPEQTRMATPDQRNDIFSLGCVLCDLHLGVWSRPVINRCRRKAEKRYASVSALRRALRRAHSLLYIIGGLLVVICLVGVAIISPHLTSPRGGGTGYAIETGSSSNVTSNPIPSPIPASPKREEVNHANANALVSSPSGGGREGAGVKAASFIAKGKAELDKRVAAYGMDTRLDTLTHVRYIEGTIMELYNEVKDFAHQYALSCTETGGLSGEEKENARIEIENTLLLYFNSQYMFPWNERIEKK